jgi:peptidylprolyl isomerase
MENKHIAGMGFIALVVIITIAVFTQKPQKSPLDTADQFNPFANKGQSSVNPTPVVFTQLKAKDIKVGSGSATVKEGDTTTVNYSGALSDGRVFDSSYSRNKPFTFMVGSGQVIKGWEQGIIGMKLGGKRQLLIPADLAYGAQGKDPIPPNASLVFEIEVLDIQEAPLPTLAPQVNQNITSAPAGPGITGSPTLTLTPTPTNSPAPLVPISTTPTPISPNNLTISPAPTSTSTP